MVFGTNPQNEVQSLSTLITRGDTTGMQLKAFSCNNMGNTTLLVKLSMSDFYRISQVANDLTQHGEVAQRKLDPKHANELARYILKGLLATAVKIHEGENNEMMRVRKELQEVLGKQPYQALQPIVANLRTAGRNGVNLRAQYLETSEREPVAIRLWLGQRDILWIVDGQHRRKAMQIVLEFLDELVSNHKYPPKKQSLFPHGRDDRSISATELSVWDELRTITQGDCTVAIEIHLGLDPIEERQLFHDLNNKAKSVEKSLALEFDSANPVNAFIRYQLLENNLIKISSKDENSSKNEKWEDDDGSFTLKELVSVNAHLILNKSNINSATPPLVKPKEAIAKRFWEAVTSIHGFGEPGAKIITVAAQPVMLKALAKLTYDFAFGRQSDEILLDKLLDGITDIDFSHDNLVWRYYELTPEEVVVNELSGLTDYLPEGKRDLGNFDGKLMKFSPKHNDTFPILGDMIRWILQLPNRHEK